MRSLIWMFTAIALFGCGQEQAPEPEEAAPAAEPVEAAPAPAGLADILAAQPEEVRARYPHRNPQATLEFFGIEPGMTVVEALPGGGWYSKVLLPYLGSSGQLVGADYSPEMWAKFSFMTPESLKAKETWVADWTAKAEGWRQEGDASVSAFQMSAAPASMEGQADAFLFIRAMHNLARFSEPDSGYLADAIQEAYRLLKPGGVVGVVQHQAADEMPDEWADGSRGYLKRDFVISSMEAAGFELVDSSDINANPKDQPTEDDIVWRLPPNLATSRDDPELRATLTEVGESNRMTLKFVKPVS